MVFELGLRIGVVVTALAAVGFGISLFGFDRFRRTLTDRFLYGVPWGSLLVIGGVLAFYLFAQGGLRHWDAPVTVAFRNWAYPYATGMFTSGFAHASPSHLLGNLLATVVLAPLAEFIWGHYPERRPGRPTQHRRDAPATPAATEFDVSPDEEPIPSGHAATDGATVSSESDTVERTVGAETGRQGETTQLRDRPAVRAFVIFPGVVVAVSVLTSLYALGWSLGFSGTVFALLGFVLLKYPIPTAVALLAVSLLNTLLNTLLTPVLRATAETGPPQPPGWAGVNVQAHMLGFLIGVMLALALLWRREELPDPTRLFFATVLVASAQGLWQLSAPSNGVFVRYQAIGVVFILLLAMLVTYVTVSDNVVLSGWSPTAIRALGGIWVFGAVAAAAGALAVVGTDTMTILSVAAAFPLTVVPGVALVVPDAVSGWPVTTRRLLFVSVLLVTVVIAAPSVPGNAADIDSEAVPEGTVTVEDYHVGYAENITHGRTGGSDAGLVVVSEKRYVWTVAASADELAHRNTATVPVGGVGWREPVDAERTGWNVVGNDSVYVVDLETDETSVRSFVSEPSRASATLNGSHVTLEPTDDEFLLTVTRNGEAVGSTALPEANGTAGVADFVFTTEERNGTVILFAATGNSRVVIAQQE